MSATSRSGNPTDFQARWNEVHAMESRLTNEEASLALAYLVGTTQAMLQPARAYALLADIEAACRYAQSFGQRTTSTNPRTHHETSHPQIHPGQPGATPDPGHEPLDPLPTPTAAPAVIGNAEPTTIHPTHLSDHPAR